jgi:hypothetical protein
LCGFTTHVQTDEDGTRFARVGWLAGGFLVAGISVRVLFVFAAGFAPRGVGYPDVRAGRWLSEPDPRPDERAPAAGSGPVSDGATAGMGEDSVQPLGAEPDDASGVVDHVVVERVPPEWSVEGAMHSGQLVGGWVSPCSGNVREGHGAPRDRVLPEVVAGDVQSGAGSRSRLRLLNRAAVVEMRTTRVSTSGTYKTLEICGVPSWLMVARCRSAGWR